MALWSLPCLVLVLLLSGRASGQSPWVQDWLREYASGRWGPVAERLRTVGSLKQLQDDLDKVAPTWLAAPSAAPDTQRRVLAAFALEAAYARLNQAAAAAKLAEWGCRQVRRNPKPDEFDRRWHWAAIALLEGAVDPDTLESHVAHMRFQFPGEPRLTLVRGVAEELRVFLLVTRGQSSAAEIAQHNEEAARRFQEAAKDETARAEAYLRLGHVLIQLGRHAQALDALDRVEPGTNDPDLIYLGRLFRGQALDRLSRADEARDGYDAALKARPGAQTATISLAALLFRSGHRDEASQLTERLLNGRNVPDDPWWNYWPGDFRLADRLIAAMREAVK